MPQSAKPLRSGKAVRLLQYRLRLNRGTAHPIPTSLPDSLSPSCSYRLWNLFKFRASQHADLPILIGPDMQDVGDMPGSDQRRKRTLGVQHSGPLAFWAENHAIAHAVSPSDVPGGFVD